MIIGRSMFPALKEGWKVRTLPVEPRDVEVGDIVVFGKGILTCHRIVGKVKRNGKLNFLQTGDCYYIPRLLSGDNIIGKVIEVMDSNGREICKSHWMGETILPEKFSLLSWQIATIFSTFKRKLLGDYNPSFLRVLFKYYWKFNFILASLFLKRKDF